MSFFLASAALSATSALLVLALLTLAVLSLAIRARARRAEGRAAAAEASVFALRIELAAREATEALLATRIDGLLRQHADLEQFAQIASHDLRAPLRAIANLAQWIDEDSGEALSAESREHLALLRGRTDRMRRLLRDLLTYSRAGRGAIELETVDLSLLVAEIAEENDPDRLNLELRVQPSRNGLNTAADLPTLVTAAAPLRQVIANLVSNAVKHHDQHQAQVTVDVSGEVSGDGDWLTLTVTDDGPGIDPELFPKALMMFQTLQADSEAVGSGMGLALVKRLVSSAGGELELRSPVERGRGLAVSVKWPRRWPEAPP